MTDATKCEIESLFSVKGKIALVTGGTSGIGRMIATGLTAAGCRVYVAARSADDCAQTVAELAGSRQSQAIVGDLSTLEGVRRIAHAFSLSENRLDILVNNAGVFKTQSIDEYSEVVWDEAMDLNLKSAFFLTQHLLEPLRNAGSAADPARIVNIGSGLGIRVGEFEAYAYQSSKAALHHLSRLLARRLVKENITVNAIAPGVFHSRNTASFSRETVDAIINRVPRGRYGEAADIVGALLYLTSRAGAYVTATVLSVDGGGAGAA